MNDTMDFDLIAFLIAPFGALLQAILNILLAPLRLFFPEL